MAGPWQRYEKSTYHEFLDVMAQLPDVIADGYALIGSLGQMTGTEVIDPMSILTKALEIINRAWQVDAKFRAFYTALERENPGQLYWPELSAGIITTDDEEELGKVFPVAFQFLSIKYAHICVLFWASTAILWAGMSYMYKVIAGFQSTPSPQTPDTASTESGSSSQPGFSMDLLPPLEYRTDLSIPAKKICQTVEFTIRHEDQSPWATRAVFPLKVCIEAFHDTPGCEREMRWSIAAMKKLLGTGVRILGHLKEEDLTAHGFLPG